MKQLFIVNNGSKCLEARLVIVGDGNISQYLGFCSGLWGKVIFTGRLDKKQLYTLFRISELGVLPSLQEQCSYVGIEMMMHGIPVVGTDAMGISEMMEKEYQVPLIAKGNELLLCADRLSEIMLKVMMTREHLGKQSRLRFEKQYSLSIMQSEIIQLYNDLRVNSQHIV